MANKANALLSFWQNVKCHKENGIDTCIAEDDYEILKNNNLLTKKLTVHNPKNKLLYKDLPCEPFVGDIENAKIYLVTLNPGAKKNEHENWENKDLLKLRKNNIKQTNQYPFYYLDPILAKTGGGKYWKRKDRFGGLIEHFSSLVGGKENAMKLIATNVCDLELCPYHSEEWDEKTNKIIGDLSSVKTMIDFLKDKVIPDVISGRKSLIVMRSVTKISKFLRNIEFDCNGKKIKFDDLDKEFPENIAFYRTKELYRFARLNENTPGGQIIRKQLRKLII